ncbi:MAG: hypothetical protein IPI92_13010 [Gemmatimonadetes bacterium]|jgi:hypothetical protein|nr:hypothetical protein [Gemmatimonadota bacterium]MBK7785928.1 hypothetical protein [Gemmatimonadota bacterium]
MKPGRLAFLAFVLLAAALALQTWRLDRAEARAQVAALARDSAEAVLDSTRAASARVQAVLGAQLTAVQRRTIQQRQRADSLDRALGLERRARVLVELRADSLQVLATATVTADSADSVRRARFEVREPPYTATADVALPRPPATGQLSLRVGLAPAPLELRIGCGAARGGIRPATVTAVGPRWLALELAAVEQDPAVCQAPAGLPPKKKPLPWREGLILLLGLRVLGVF